MTLGDRCTDENDKLLGRIAELARLGEILAASDDEIDQLAQIRHIAGRCRVGNVGAKGNWNGNVQDVRYAVGALETAGTDLVTDITQQALNRLVGALGKFTLHAAEERRSQGRLEFHDLLVRARRLLRDPKVGPEVRRSLRGRYQRLLIDEFQDTDPIQVDLAILLGSPDDDAAGRSWADVIVDAGRLFFVGAMRELTVLGVPVSDIKAVSGTLKIGLPADTGRKWKC